MKKIIPVKYIIILSIVSLVAFPILLYVLPLIIFYLLTLGKWVVPYYVIFIGMAFGGIVEMLFLCTPEYCELVIKDGMICNFINDGTNNDGWCEEILNIRTIALVGKEDVQKYYKQFNKSKALLIDFGDYNIKYIYAGWFSKRQIEKIMNLIAEEKNQLDFE